MNKKYFVSIPLVFFIAFLLVFPVSAQENQASDITDDEVNAVAKQLYCPVCENIPLDVCGTQACAQWRELIREKLSQGWDEDQIKEYFVLQYGDRVLAEPPRRGLNWLVYILPPVAFVTGVIILFRGIQSWRSHPDSDDDKVEPIEKELGEYISRMEQELLNKDKS